MRRTVVLNVVGLTPALLGRDTPNLLRLARGLATVGGVTPAVTCTVQSTYLTGLLPREHGAVANGWYFRDLDQVWLWRQSNRLVQGDKIWHMGRRRDPAFTCANTFWWYNMATETDWAVTPRPIYTADGRKLPDCASDPPELRDRLTSELGAFPLFTFWGPATSIRSSEWIGQAAMLIESLHRPSLQVVYLPHLDYVLQRVGPQGAIDRDLQEIDALCGRLLDYFMNRGCRVVVLSEYGISEVRGAVHPNRLLRAAGLLQVKVDLGREYLDPGRSRAFAVADHQIAHVYVRDPADLPRAAEALRRQPGIADVLDEAGKRAYGLDHPRSGELVLLSEPDRWFSYYFWEDDRRAPDWARTVDIHSKPGYDPCELLLDPALRLPKLHIGWTLLKRRLGQRALLEVIPLDADLVHGSHGLIPADPQHGPLLMTSDPDLLPGAHIEATQVCATLLDHVFAE